jgi:hypothetical protein
MYFDTSLKTSRVDLSALSSPRRLSRNGNFFFPSKNGKKWILRNKQQEREEMDGSDGTRKDTEDTTTLVRYSGAAVRD